MRFDLSDEEWAVIQPHLPIAGRGPKRVDDRRVLNGIFYILRTGAPWRDLPERYGPRRRGVWKAIFDALASQNEDSLFFIDSSIVKAHRAATGAKGGNWRRISAAHAEAVQVKFMPLSMKVDDLVASSSRVVRFTTAR